MIRCRAFAAIVACTLVASAAVARSRHGGPQLGQPGAFDYYVLSLSWSPQYCANRGEGNRAECVAGRRYAFVLHGLWPQYEHGFPRFCAAGGTLSPQLIDGMLDIMPSAQLVQHEWETHGTCSGLAATAYFDRARAAFQDVNIPAPYKSPTSALRVSSVQLQNQFLHANPKLSAADIAVLCDGRYLQEVRICLDRGLQPRACGRELRGRCRVREIIVPPVR